MKAGEDGKPVLPFASREDFARWLDEHHASSDGIWIKYAKKASGIGTVVYAEALDVALRYGWIDGQVAAIDGDWYAQRWTPRRARSKWSKINREKAEELIASDAMKPAGLAEVERAKADGRWEEAYPSPSSMGVPDDLQAALDANPKAAEFFATLSGSNRYAVLYRIHDAKRAETRARRIEKFVGMLARGEKFYG
jgi:uncharacterized protein YdeI (YjbR/CyaY-like superfamily)